MVKLVLRGSWVMLLVILTAASVAVAQSESEPATRPRIASVSDYHFRTSDHYHQGQRFWDAGSLRLR
jgi:hypothetical protein